MDTPPLPPAARSVKIVQSAKAALWLIGIVAIGYGATVLQERLSAAYRAYALYIGILVWTVFAIAYVLHILPFLRLIEDRVHKLIATTDEESHAASRRTAQSIAMAVVAGLTIIWLLLLFDYHGHNDAAAYAAGAKQNAAGAAPDFLQRVGAYLGPFGDFFGGILNPILTFGTLVALSITIVMQRTQLHGAAVSAQEQSELLQQQLTVAENSARDNAALLQKQFDATERRASESAALIGKQTFETTFFNMVKLHNATVDSLRFNPTLIELPLSAGDKYYEREYFKPAPNDKVAVGREVFARILQMMEEKNTNLSPGAIYEQIQVHHNYVLGHYFRNLYQVLSLVDEYARLTDFKEAKRYSNIIRAQLSANELLLLLYNCAYALVDDGQFRALLKRYEILEHTPLECVVGRHALGTPGFSFRLDHEVRQYLEVDRSSGKHALLPGAFGKNRQVSFYIYQDSVLSDNA